MARRVAKGIEEDKMKVALFSLAVIIAMALLIAAISLLAPEFSSPRPPFPR